MTGLTGYGTIFGTAEAVGKKRQRHPLVLSAYASELSSFHVLNQFRTQNMKDNKNFPLTIEHIRAMFKVADHRERVISSLATDLGLRMGDFIRLKKIDIPDLSQESPISIDVMTGKENIVAHGFISSESAELLKTYLPTLRKDDNAYLFPSNGKSHISDEWVNRLLRSLADKAGIYQRVKQLLFVVNFVLSTPQPLLSWVYAMQYSSRIFLSME